ncbi:diguanylate cyclase [Idiomarina sp. HP20-50]|uniref:sensor domain-containing diguanylate cyclase n=1 Tax=Idiomarina sp. HP20-50 TaxID=3070813 RepID=UPI00294AFC06|nr:diguanylate cyclase [Idiomarina sp. HP20-50]MDV6316614.1 diguanylate cyclase [Idiomarina sp. HP20-50]
MSADHITHKVIAQLPTMVAYVDQSRCFRFVNTAYASFFGLKPDDMLGKPVLDVLSDESYQRVKPNHDHVFSHGEKMEFSESITFRNGRKCFLDIRYLPEFDDKNDVIGLYALIEDVTDYYASVDLMRTIHEVIHKRGRRIDPASINELLKVGVDYLGTDIGTASSIKGGTYTIEWAQTAKMDFPAGTQLPLETTYCSVVLEANDLIYTNDASTDSRFKEHASYRTYGLETYIGTPLIINDQVWGILGFARKSKRADPFSELEVEMVRMMGTAVETVIAEQEIRSDLIRQRDDMAVIAYTDSLTGLKNRSAGMQILEQSLERQSGRQKCVVSVIDFDHFKNINDTYGHDVGDKVLIAGAAAMSDAIRSSDSVVRVGGEEFMVVLAYTDHESAAQVLERVRKTVEDTVVTLDSGETINPTVSIGASESRADDDVSSIYRRADQALYKAKRAGRNCVIWEDGSDS